MFVTENLSLLQKGMYLLSMRNDKASFIAISDLDSSSSILCDQFRRVNQHCDLAKALDVENAAAADGRSSGCCGSWRKTAAPYRSSCELAKYNNKFNAL